MIRKFASASILDARMGEDTGFAKNAHRAVFNYIPKPGYLYVRSRAISSRCNDNFDMFPAEEIEKSYLSFIGKPVFVNHHNEDHHRARGVIIDAALHKDINPDGSPDTWAEVLHEVDAMTYPKLAKAILAKEVNRTSMGCDVQFSKCAACGNVATSPLEYCTHIPGKKGRRIVTGKVGSNGKRETQLIFEICSGLSFFENSLLVEQPADPTAYFLGEVEYGPGLDHLGVSRTAAFHPASPTGLNEARHVEETNDTDGYDSGFTSDRGGIHVHDYPRAIHELQANYNVHDDNLADEYNPDKRRDSLRRREVGKLINSLETHHQKESTWNKTASRTMSNSNSIWDLIKQADLTGDDLEDLDAWAHTSKLNDEHPYEAVVPAQRLKEMSPDQKKTHTAALKDHATKWAARNPVHPQNIVDHYNASTDEERNNGHNWYGDAHHTAKIIADGTHTPLHAMAGLISNYSPQTHWATNVVNAATAARLKTGIGGKGNKDGYPAIAGPKAGQPRGIMASEGQRQIGHLLANAPHDEDDARASGQHYDQLLKGPKTKAFAHLIHTGGDDHTVVVDRHAYSVASGARASDAAYGFSGLGGKKKYNDVSEAYRQAAHTLSDQHGQTIHPHQVQATTWLVRQRLNEAGDRELVRKGSRSATAARSAIAEMHHYMGEHHPEASIQMPGTGYSKDTGLVTGGGEKKESLRSFAYGETKAPQDVDTLRAENCTVCGNSTAFDGVQCQICGYTSPPRPFGDPDTDTAKAQDLRKQVLDSDDGTADPNDPDQQLGNQVGDPSILDDQADEAQEEGTVPALTCTNCGTGIVPSPAQSGTEQPYPAEGDVCPVCKSGDLAAEGGEGADEDVDGDGVPDSEEEEGDSNGQANLSGAEEEPDDEDEEDDEGEEEKPPKKDKK